MKKEITTLFNVFATVIIFFIEVIASAMTYDINSPTPDGTVMHLVVESPWLRILSFILLWVITAMLFSYIVKEIWNRFLSDLLQKREINFKESYAVTVILVWLIV